MSTRPSGASAHRPEGLRGDSDSDLVAVAGRLLWRWRLEVGLAALLGVPFAWLSLNAGWPVATAVIAPVVVLLVAIGSVRRRLGAALRRAHWQRKMARALDALVDAHLSGIRPWITQVGDHGLGVAITLRLRRGLAAAQLDAAREHFAAALRVRDVRVERDATDASRVDLVVVSRDPLARPLPCPWLDTERTDVWDPIPIGVYDSGDVVSIELFEHSLLVGGVPGSGKSGLLSLLAARTALDPYSGLWVLDPKGVELLRWERFAISSAGPSIADAVEVLQFLNDELDARNLRLKVVGLRKVDRRGWGLHVLLVDELAVYLSDPDKKQVARFIELLRRLCMLGRAAGVVPIVATQKPSTEAMPSSIRDVLSWRMAFRCTTRDASDTVLCAGAAARGFTASDIDPRTPGVAYFLGDAPDPRRIRTFCLSDAELDVLVERARHLRS